MIQFLRLRKQYLVAVIALFSVSLLLPSFEIFRPGTQTGPGYFVFLEAVNRFSNLFVLKVGTGVSGLEMFLAGWLGPADNIFAWYANLFGLIAFVMSLKGRYVAGILNSVIAIVLGSQSLFLSKIGWIEHVYNIGIGFFVWESCFVLIFFYSYVGLRLNQSK